MRNASIRAQRKLELSLCQLCVSSGLVDFILSFRCAGSSIGMPVSESCAFVPKRSSFVLVDGRSNQECSFND